ncbi:MAG: hypothetical protein GY862_37360 [Gammaproteobacteria bacterium]|nr:hypothetical protein [Gammaproteobacteria bacterium]
MLLILSKVQPLTQGELARGLGKKEMALAEKIDMLRELGLITTLQG